MYLTQVMHPAGAQACKYAWTHQAGYRPWPPAVKASGQPRQSWPLNPRQRRRKAIASPATCPATAAGRTALAAGGNAPTGANLAPRSDTLAECATRLTTLQISLPAGGAAIGRVPFRPSTPAARLLSSCPATTAPGSPVARPAIPQTRPGAAQRLARDRSAATRRCRVSRRRSTPPASSRPGTGAVRARPGRRPPAARPTPDAGPTPDPGGPATSAVMARSTPSPDTRRWRSATRPPTSLPLRPGRPSATAGQPGSGLRRPAPPATRRRPAVLPGRRRYPSPDPGLIRTELTLVPDAAAQRTWPTAQAGLVTQRADPSSRQADLAAQLACAATQVALQAFWPRVQASERPTPAGAARAVTAACTQVRGAPTSRTNRGALAVLSGAGSTRPTSSWP
jgi:hypothetical protein